VKPRKSADSIAEKRTYSNIHIVKDCYTSYENFCNGIKLLKFAPKWSFVVTDNFTNVTKSSVDFSVPEVEIYIYHNLTFTIRILTWLLPMSHEIYIRFSKTMKNVKLQQLIAAIDNHNICAGLPVEAYRKIIETPTAMITHCIPKKFDPTIELTNLSPLNQHIFYRSPTCTILTNNIICHDCRNTEHLLVFLIRSVVNPFKFSFANFATTGATSTQLFPIFWKAVYILERTCKLKVVATTCDGASPNRKFFRMHDAMISNGVSYVLTERFCQDPLENYFGRQRSMGARKDNPSLRDVGYNDNTIRNQKVFRPINGNVQPDDYELQINDDPLPCRKKPRK